MPEIVRHGIDGFIVDEPAKTKFAVMRAALEDRKVLVVESLKNSFDTPMSWGRR